MLQHLQTQHQIELDLRFVGEKIGSNGRDPALPAYRIPIQRDAVLEPCELLQDTRPSGTDVDRAAARRYVVARQANDFRVVIEVLSPPPIVVPRNQPTVHAPRWSCQPIEERRVLREPSCQRQGSHRTSRATASRARLSSS